MLRELENIINKKNFNINEQRIFNKIHIQSKSFIYIVKKNINKNGLKVSENIKKFNKIVELNLNNCGLDILPDSFDNLINLKNLNLKENKLKGK